MITFPMQNLLTFLTFSSILAPSGPERREKCFITIRFEDTETSKNEANHYASYGLPSGGMILASSSSSTGADVSLTGILSLEDG